MMFKAKATHTLPQLEMYGMLNHPAHLGDGWFKGYYVDGYIAGKFVDMNWNYTNLEYWVPVDKRTLQMVGEEDD